MENEREIFYKALLEKDNSFEDVLIVGVKTTGVFCRPTCPAKPKLENCEFFPSANEAMLNGYRPCKICNPLEKQGNSSEGIKMHGMNNAFQRIQIVNITYLETDLGLMIAAATSKGICMLEFADYKLLDLELRQLASYCKAPLVQGENSHFEILREQLDEYFKGKRKEFDIPLDLVGTEFQKKVWLGLLKIPYGTTINYGKQAELLGKPSAVRAVANANGKNKISIVLPCHRVIGADGTLTGYGGGIWRKKKLLAFEKENTTTDEK